MANEYGVEWTNTELRQNALQDYKDCRKVGIMPEWYDDLDTIKTEKDWAAWGNEYMMSAEEFKKYVHYFLQYIDGVI